MIDLLRHTDSIKARLSLVFMILLLLVIGLGLQSLASLRYSNEVSAQIRVRWLPSTRALGDLNNFTTDFPAAEAALIRSRSESERAALIAQMVALDRGITDAQRAYQQVHHDAGEDVLYRRFYSQWNAYRVQVKRAETLAIETADSDALPAIERSSKAAYSVASESLGLLTERNIASARDASERSEEAYLQARGRIVLMILVAGLFVGGAMLYVMRSISGPLVELAQRMHRLAASETGIEVFGTERRDEIGEMARAVVVFRNNALDLAQNRQALARQASMLEEKLAEEQRLTRLQRNFVSMASHEFRTPLGIIDGHAQRLVSMRDRLTSNALGERAQKIRSAVHRMTQLIDNLISSARLIDGRIELYCHPTCLDLLQLLQQACHLQRELTPHVQILVTATPASLPVRGDSNLLLQLFGNLLANAVKYSPGGGLIRLRASQDRGHAVVAIQDHGIGIPERELQRVFERYYRASNTSGISGTGVGLSLVASIVEIHAGTIKVDSREGGGSTFTVRLPAVERVTAAHDGAAAHA